MPHCPPGQLAHFGTNPWETPFAELEDEASLSVFGNIKVYGDMPPWGKGPDPQKVYGEGYGYLAREFPELDYLETCVVVGDEAAAERGLADGEPEDHDGEF